jgi:hypothetical protein
MVLRVALEGGKLTAATDAALSSAPSAAAVYFTKLRPCRLVAGPAALHDIAISSVPTSPLDSLYSAVHGVFAPALLGPQQQQRLGDKLRGMLGDLDKALATAVRSAAAADPSAAAAAGSLAGVVSVRDEQRYWEDTGRSILRPQDRERPQAFVRLLEPLALAFDGLDAASPAQLAEVSEDVQGHLDALWRTKTAAADAHASGFPAARMRNLLGVMSAALRRRIQVRYVCQVRIGSSAACCTS